MRTWPPDWDERRRGKGCEMCSPDRPDDTGFGLRIHAGRQSDAYLQRKDVGQPGYTLVIWRGPHVSDPTELSDEQATTYFRDVLKVARAIEGHYHPIKMNFEMLGNSVPHLHTHVIPRYLDDGSPGLPARFMRSDVQDAPNMPEERFLRDVRALRDLLT